MTNGIFGIITIVGTLSLLINRPLALQIGAFNLGVYGKTKSSKSQVVSIITEIVQRYDIVLLQEIRDASEEVIYNFIDLLNSIQSNYTYNLVLGPRLGRTSSKEQYAYIYRSEIVQVLHSYTYMDSSDVFEREPLLVHIRDLTRKPIPDVVLIGVHVKPSDARAELDGLVKVYEEAVRRFLTFNILLLGDLNADCSYVSNSAYDRLNITTDKRFVWLIGKSEDTTVADTHCAYDRFVATLASKKLVDRDVVNVFKFDEYFNLTQTQARKVSDHYPIELTLREECGKAPPTTIPPTITAPPKPTVDIAPYSASFSCSAKGMGNVKISWKREDGQALPSKAVTAVQDSGNDEMTTTGFLIISDITAYDMGKYCCVASNEAGEVTSDCAQLTVQIPPPVIEKHPEDMSVSQGTTVTFNCEATSYGDTSYLWQRVDGGKLDSSRVTGVNSNKLTITNPVPDDTGSYICIASNKDGKIVSRKADLNVQAQCLTNLTIDNGYVMFSADSKLVAYRCFDGFRLLGSTTAECMQDGTWSSPPPECTVDSCTNIGVTNCAHFTNVDDQGNVLCMCRPGYRVDLSNSSNCIDIDECKLDDTLCHKECVNTEGSYYCQCPSLYALATNETSCIECGTSRTINDQSNHVKRKKFDWHVQLCNSSADNDYENVLCSGSLINDQWVLTSAECVCEGQDNSKLIVNVHKTTNCSKPLNNGTSRTVASVKCHEGYKSKVVGYNVALLKLSSPVNAVPVCLPKDSISMNFHEARNKVMMTGWGSSSMLRYSELYTVPNTDCKKSYGGQYDVSFNSVCTDKFNRDGHCDNGSPMMFQVKHSSSHSWLMLVGIANEACQATQPYDVYTSTTGTDIYNWIAKTTGLHI